MVAKIYWPPALAKIATCLGRSKRGEALSSALFQAAQTRHYFDMYMYQCCGGVERGNIARKRSGSTILEAVPLAEPEFCKTEVKLSLSEGTFRKQLWLKKEKLAAMPSLSCFSVFILQISVEFAFLIILFCLSFDVL